MKKEQSNPVKDWWNNVKNTKQNYQKVKASPYASLVFRNKIAKMIIFPLIGFLIWKGYDTIINYNVDGFMNTVGKVIMFFVFAFIIWRVYKIIPQSKKQLEYYRKYPHVINYCPTNVKEDIDDILNKVKDNQAKSDGGRKNVSEKEKGNGKETRDTRKTKTSRS